MQTANNTKQAAPAANAKGNTPATVAPATTGNTPAATVAPVALVWANPQHANSYAKPAAALQSLATQGAVLVRLPCPANKLSTMLANMPGLGAPVAGLPALVGKTAHGWAAFNVGYLGGTNASYAACAAQHGNKKAKANPAFAYCLPDGTLLTANGTPWVAPPASDPAHVLAAYAQAQAAVTAYLASVAPAAPAKA